MTRQIFTSNDKWQVTNVKYDCHSRSPCLCLNCECRSLLRPIVHDLHRRSYPHLEIGQVTPKIKSRNATHHKCVLWPLFLPFFYKVLIMKHYRYLGKAGFRSIAVRCQDLTKNMDFKHWPRLLPDTCTSDSVSAFYFLYKDVGKMPDGSAIEDFKSLPGSVMSLIHMTFGDFNVCLPGLKPIFLCWLD